MDLETIYKKYGEHSQVMGALQELDRITHYWASIANAPAREELLMLFIKHRANALLQESKKCMAVLKQGEQNVRD